MRNLLTFNNGITSHTYTYSNEDWKDLLTAVDGQTLTYDEIGNPLTYYNGQTYTMTWTEGRRLESVTLGEDTTTYKYDYNGYRIQKTSPDGSYTKYYIVDGRTVGEVQFDADGTKKLYMRYTYDESGSVIGFSLWYEGDTDWTHYYFLRNLQGDILQIYNGSTNELVAEYTYDSWGNVLSATGELAELNPFRYRGYYYDVETGFYYLTSRYYDAEIGRFLNVDGVIDNRGTNTLNLFAYCANNPINNVDSNGYLFVGALVGGVIGGIVGGLGALVTGNSVTAGVITGAMAGAAIGAVGDAVVTGGLSVVAGALICGAISGVANFTNQVVNNYIQADTNDNASGNKKNPTQRSENKFKQTTDTFIDSVLDVDYGSVVQASVTSMVFAPVSFATGNLVNSVYAGCQSSGLNLTGEIIGSTFMEINNSLIQFIIELF